MDKIWRILVHSMVRILLCVYQSVNCIIDVQNGELNSLSLRAILNGSAVPLKLGCDSYLWLCQIPQGLSKVLENCIGYFVQTYPITLECSMKINLSASLVQALCFGLNSRYTKDFFPGFLSKYWAKIVIVWTSSGYRLIYSTYVVRHVKC